MSNNKMDCLAKNKNICPCKEECDFHGKCCECIKYHIGNKEYPQTACMKQGKLK